VASVFILLSFVVVYRLASFYVPHGDLWWMRGAFYGIGMAATAGITRRHARDAWTIGPSVSGLQRPSHKGNSPRASPTVHELSMNTIGQFPRTSKTLTSRRGVFFAQTS
jgi:hypothetical protein